MCVNTHSKIGILKFWSSKKFEMIQCPPKENWLKYYGMDLEYCHFVFLNGHLSKCKYQRISRIQDKFFF